MNNINYLKYTKKLSLINSFVICFVLYETRYEQHNYFLVLQIFHYRPSHFKKLSRVTVNIYFNRNETEGLKDSYNIWLPYVRSCRQTHVSECFHRHQVTFCSTGSEEPDNFAVTVQHRRSHAYNFRLH